MIEFLSFFLEEEAQELQEYYASLNNLEEDEYRKNAISWWYQAIQQSQANAYLKKRLMAIVDLSYNYSIERAIEDVVFHYRKTNQPNTNPVLSGYEESSLRKDFQYRLRSYLTSSHHFPIESSIQEPMNLPKKSSLHWADAYTISNIHQEKEEEVFSYEDGILR